MTHQDKQGVSLFRVSENMDGQIRVGACTRLHKANQFCFCVAVLSHPHYLNAKDHLMIGEIFLVSSDC